MSVRKLSSAGLITVLALSLAGAVAAVPRMSLPETVFNFGYCPQNSEVSHKFWLVSSGDQTLKILKIIPGCSCTKAPLDKEELASGDSTQLEIIYSTRSSLDRVSKSPTIQTNEGPPDKRLQIVATVVAHPDSTFPFVVQPYKLDLTQKTGNLIDRMEFGIRNVSDKELKVEIVSGATDYFQVELPKLIKPGELAKGRVIILKGALEKSFEKSFTIEASDDAGTRFTVPVKRLLATDLLPTSAGK